MKRLVYLRHVAGLAAIVSVFLLGCLPRAATAQEREAYRLGPGDTVEVMVNPGLPEPLSLVVDNEGRILMPLLGSVELDGMTTREAADELSVQLREGEVFADPIVAVSLAAARPVYVTGDVDLPGAYPGRLGMRVDEAIALAGGIRAQAQNVELTAAQVAELQSELVGIVAELEVLAVQKARLQAVADGDEFNAETQVSGEAATDDEAVVQGEFISRVRALEEAEFETSRETFRQQRAALEETLLVLAEEKEAILTQRDALERIVEIQDEEVSASAELEERGLGLRRQSLANERALFSARAELAEQGRRLAAARQNEIELRQQIRDLEAERRRQALAELSQLELQRVTLLAQRDALVSRLGYGSVYDGAAGSPLGAQGSVATIIERTRRLPSGERVSERVSEDAELMPGDLIAVRILPNFELIQ